MIHLGLTGASSLDATVSTHHLDRIPRSLFGTLSSEETWPTGGHQCPGTFSTLRTVTGCLIQ